MTYTKLTQSDHNSDRQFLAPRYSVLVRTGATFQVGDLIHSQLASPLLFPIRVCRVIVLWGNDTGGLIVREVRNNVAPWLVVVDTQCDNVALVRVGLETNGAARPACAYLEQMVTVDLVPGSTIAVFPECLLDGTEECVPPGISLIDIHLE